MNQVVWEDKRKYAIKKKRAEKRNGKRWEGAILHGVIREGLSDKETF